MSGKQLKDLITWEWLAVTMVSILIAVMAHFGKGVINNVEALRETLSDLNTTMNEFKVEMARSKIHDEMMIKRMDKLEEETSSRFTRLWQAVREKESKK